MEPEQTIVAKSHPDAFVLLKIRPKLGDFLWLPWWYHINILYLKENIQKALTECPPGFFALEHARLLSGCYCDREYIDKMMEYALPGIESLEENRRVQVYLDIGLTLCDLGYYSEGVFYVEKAISFEKRPYFRSQCLLHLCYRLNKEAKYEKVITLAEKLVKETPKNSLAKMVLVKTCIDAGKLDDVKSDIYKIVLEYPKAFGFLLAYCYFSLKDYKAASSAFDKYEINRRLCFWLPEYDYKKAVAYHYSGQQYKCHKQVERIRRRMNWDGFYRLECINNLRIDRVPAVDEMIISNDFHNSFFDTDKTSHYVKTICHIMRLYVEEHWAVLPILAVMVLLVVKLICCIV